MKRGAVVSEAVKQIALPDVRRTILDDVTFLVHLYVLQISDQSLARSVNSHAVILKQTVDKHPRIPDARIHSRLTHLHPA